MAKGGNGNSGSTSTSGSTSNSGNTGTTGSGMSIGFGGGMSGFSSGDQGGAGGWTSNSFGSGINATGSGTSVGGSSGSEGSGQTFGESLVGGNESDATWSGNAVTATPQQIFEMAKQKQREQVQEKGLLKSILEGNSSIPTDNPTALTGLAQVAGTIAGLFGPNGKAKGEEGVSNPTYNPSIAAETNTPAAMKEGPKNYTAAPTTESSTSNAEATSTAIGNLGFSSFLSSFAPPSETNSNANQQAQSSSGYINRGSTISTTGTGGSISSGLTGPERDSGSIGLGVFDPDKANYDQDNWNRGMEVQSSSVVSDEQCKQFAMRAFHEDSPAFKVVKETIIKKLD